MKQPKRLTRDQKIILNKCGLVPTNWMLVKETERQLVIIHKTSKTIKKINK